MMATSSPFETGTSQRKFKPLLICAAPKPSEVAVPNSVAQIANTSIALPIGPFDALADQRVERRADQVRHAPCAG